MHSIAMNARRPHGPLTIRRSLLSPHNILLLTLPMLSAFQVSLIGQFMLSDVVVVAVFGALLARGKVSLRYPFLKILLLMWALWFGMAVVSDMVNDSPLHNLLRGWALIGLFGIYIVTVFNLVQGKRDRVLLCILGLGLGYVMRPLLMLADGQPLHWKLGIGLGVMILVSVALAVLVRAPRVTGQIMLLVSPINLALQARGLFLLVFLSGLLSVLRLTLKKRQSRLIFGVLFSASVVISVPIAETAYDNLMRSGLFGQEALQKHLDQTAGGDVGILLGGRSETMISLTAIAQKPLLGHGSWAENRELRMLYYQRLEAAGLRGYWGSSSELIPAHSFLMGSWVEHGVVGGAFWIFCFLFAFRAMLNIVSGAYPGRPAELLIIITLLWDILFSPFGAHRRCFVAIILAVVAVVNMGKNSEIKLQHEKS